MFLDECHHHFNTKCLYEVLNVKKDCTPAELKKGYYRQSMKWHPDKSTLNDENAEVKELHTIRFQILNKAYTILSDDEKRKIYDETGSVDEDECDLSEDVLNGWRKMFKKVTKEDIDNFMKEYQGSEEQEKELIERYNEFDGDMAKITEYVIGFEDYDALKAKIAALVEEGKIEVTKKYEATTDKKKENARKRRAAREAKEAEKMLKEMTEQKGGATDLESMILARHTKRTDSFLDSLAAKYAAPKKTKKK